MTPRVTGEYEFGPFGHHSRKTVMFEEVKLNLYTLKIKQTKTKNEESKPVAY